MRPEFESFFQYLEAIHPLPPDGRERLLAFVDFLTFKKGDYFIRSGERPTRVGYMVEGWLRYFHTDAEGRQFVRYFCNGGHFVASQSALFNGEPSMYDIQVVEDAKLVVFEYHEWEKLLQTHMAWGLIHKTVLDEALARAEQRERSLVMDDARARYRLFLEEFPDAELHLKQYDIASYLGVSPVTLSRIRSSKIRPKS